MRPAQETLFPHAHDLPPKWDGYRVDWDGWEWQPMFICPPPKPECCRFCGSVSTPVINRGRAYRGQPHFLLDGVILNLQALRCPSCRHDQVITRGSAGHYAPEQWWDLDDTDYGDTGSEQP